MKNYSAIKGVCYSILSAYLIFISLISTVHSASGNTPVFIENTGQWPDSVLFVCNTGTRTLWFTENGVHHRLARVDTSVNLTSSLGSKFNGRHSKLGKFGETLPQLEYMTVSAKIEGTNPNVKIFGKTKQKQYYNFFKGKDRTKWKSHVPCFESIIYENIYPGINLEYYQNGNLIEYDFIVSSGADPSQIKMKYQGANSVEIGESGDLLIVADFGEIIESKPVVYQVIDGQRKEIEASFKLLSVSMIGFKLSEKYDRSNKLIIDPVLSYSTFLGENTGQIAFGMDLDSRGNMILSGITVNPFPIFNAYDSTFNGQVDAFVTKLTADGQEVIFSTYLGGSYFEDLSRVKIGPNDTIYVGGTTRSSDFPVWNGYDTTWKGSDPGNLDERETGFVTKFTPECDSIVYSTYVGGSSIDILLSLDVDSYGHVYVTGHTISTDLIFDYSYQRDYMYGGDAFLVKISPDGKSPVFGTYFGGRGSDFSYGLEVDDSGNAFIAGYTTSDDFPITNPADTVLWNADYDVFVAQISTNDSSLVYAVRFGSTSQDIGLDLTIDNLGDAYVTGTVFGRNFPLVNAYDSTPNGIGDLFVAKIQKNTGSLLYSTYFGGFSWDDGYSIGVDNEKRIWIAGETRSDNFPTFDAFDNTYNGKIDIFVTCFSASGSELIFSTFLGGAEWDGIFDIVIDSSNNVYLTGRTESFDYPTVNPLQAEHKGFWDVVVAKFSPVPTSIDDSAGSTLPAKYVISNNYPNPFNPSTTISYSLPEKSYTQIIVYNVLGKEVIKLVDQVKSAGNYTVMWNGKDRNGNNSATGIYFYQLVTEKYRESKKMILLK